VCQKKKAAVPTEAADPIWGVKKNRSVYCENQNEIICIVCTGLNKRLPAFKQAIEIPMVAKNLEERN